MILHACVFNIRSYALIQDITTSFQCILIKTHVQESQGPGWLTQATLKAPQQVIMRSRCWSLCCPL